jgi:hypothetical protein
VRERVRGAGGYALAVYAAAKVSKVRELRMLIATGLDGDAVALKLRRYRKSSDMLEQATLDSQVVELLRLEVEALDAPPLEPRLPACAISLRSYLTLPRPETGRRLPVDERIAGDCGIYTWGRSNRLAVDWLPP